MTLQKWNLMGARSFFRLKAEQQTLAAGLEERLHVNRNDHSHYSHYRSARRFQRHRGRTVLRHRLLWRRRPWFDRRDPADPALAREALIALASCGVGKGAPALCPPFFFSAQRR